MSLGYTRLLLSFLFRSFCAKCHVHVGDFWVKGQASWLEPGLVEPGWGFRGLASLDLAGQANVWLYVRSHRTLA